MITFNHVSKKYPGGYDALTNINLSLEKGEMVFLSGHSGSGKSTLLKLLALFERPSSGKIFVHDACLDDIKKDRIAKYRSSLGMAFQSPQLLFDRSVFDNIALPLQIQGVSPSLVTRRVRAALDLVNLLPKEKSSPIHLSCGEQQRVGIARAIVHKPDIILADEPTGNLDPFLAVEMMSLFEHLNQAGVTVIVATHDLALIAKMKYRVIILKEGRAHDQ